MHDTFCNKAEEQIENTPIVELGKAFTLRFDDLNANEAYYYYTIHHANADLSLIHISEPTRPY